MSDSAGPRLYLIPNGLDSGVSCEKCLEAAKGLPGGDYVLRCGSMGLPHAYVCTTMSKGWLLGYKLCDVKRARRLTIHTRRLRAGLDEDGRRALDGFLGLVALARG